MNTALNNTNAAVELVLSFEQVSQAETNKANKWKDFRDLLLLEDQSRLSDVETARANYSWSKEFLLRSKVRYHAALKEFRATLPIAWPYSIERPEELVELAMKVSTLN
jgi:hypothetical protein